MGTSTMTVQQTARRHGWNVMRVHAVASAVELARFCMTAHVHFDVSRGGREGHLEQGSRVSRIPVLWPQDHSCHTHTHTHTHNLIDPASRDETSRLHEGRALTDRTRLMHVVYVLCRVSRVSESVVLNCESTYLRFACGGQHCMRTFDESDETTHSSSRRPCRRWESERWGGQACTHV